ncbi:MAG: glycogen synthase GlgA [Casimicrobiaceae bacterium]
MLRVLYATSECAPWIKTGGLGDVAAALPAALRDRGVDVRVLLPAYSSVTLAAAQVRDAVPLPALGPWPAAMLRVARLPSGVPAYLLDAPQWYQRPGGPYQDDQAHDFPDNLQRFGFLARTAALLCGHASPLRWRPEVLHCNDWQTGLAPAYLHFGSGRGAASLMTIHNLAFQGLYAGDRSAELGLPAAAYAIDGVEFYGQTSLLKAGLSYADAISTVSPTYAREVQRAPLGFGLEGLLAARAGALAGILNGIDVATWNPATDPLIVARYDADTLEAKARNKAALQRELGLEASPEVPLLGMVSRLTWQKGADLVAQAIPRLLGRPLQFAIAGRGEPSEEASLVALSRAHPTRVGVAIRFDEGLAHRIEAGADAFVMPSRFEPCGLNQMYSQRYGTPPIAHATGGLADSIVDATPPALADGTASGVLFSEPTVDGLLAAIGRMLEIYTRPAAWRALQRGGMARDFGWSSGAALYAELYERIAAARRKTA